MSIGTVKENKGTDLRIQGIYEGSYFGNEIAKGMKMIAEHSGRVVVYYDVATELTRIIKHGEPLSDWLPGSGLFSFESLSEESRKRVDQMLQEIRNGGADGEVKLQILNPDTSERWLDLKYSPLVDETTGLAAAIVSYQDITEYRRYELSYLRQKQALEQEKNHMGQMEVDLNADIIEVQNGRLTPPDAKIVGRTLTCFASQMVEMKMMEEDREDGLTFFSPGYLLDQYRQGNVVLERVWKMRFYGGTYGWVRVGVELIREPYTGHVKAFFKLTDITVEKETQMLVQLRSEKDGLTGLLNRATLEHQVKKAMSGDDAPGVLILMDMDDLKEINDTYGHAEGDKAIRRIAQLMKTHFRQTDIIGRLGGDEFLVYLRGAAENPDAISATLMAFSRRLSVPAAGDEGAYDIRCSIGCAIQGPGADDFDSLYRRADIALYHVKRGTKNGFALYDAEMEQQNYQFRSEKMLSITRGESLKVPEGQRLLNAVLAYYELVLSMNLTSNSYFLAAEVSGGVFSRLPLFGSFDNFVELALKGVHPEDAAEFRRQLSREGLIRTYTEGKKGVRFRFRFINEGEYRYVEATVILYSNEGGDICDFTLLRWE